MTSVVNCLLSLRDNINLEQGEDGLVENTSKIGNGSLLNKKWRAPAPEPGKHAHSQLRVSSAPSEEKRKGHSEAKLHHTSRGMFLYLIVPLYQYWYLTHAQRKKAREHGFYLHLLM